MARRAKSPKGEAETKRPLARKAPKDDGSRVPDLEKPLAEALELLQTRNREVTELQEQRTATSEILRVIRSSPTTEGAEVAQRALPRRPGRDSLGGRAILEGKVVHLADAKADPEYSPAYQRAHQAGSGLGVPMLRDGRPIGAIAVGRYEVRPFTDQQAALLKTFADQAVIAIENVRLFTGLQEKNQALTEAHAQVTETRARDSHDQQC